MRKSAAVNRTRDWGNDSGRETRVMYYGVIFHSLAFLNYKD